MTFEEFAAHYARNVGEALQDQRAGQFAMNLLGDVRPDLYTFITGWYPVDPFYCDDFLSRFWEELAVKW